MRCCRCHRDMIRAFVWIGDMPVGPTCARLMGITPDARFVARITRSRETPVEVPGEQMQLEFANDQNN
jgi:hypothetical protein